jgi:hypothetical protein
MIFQYSMMALVSLLVDLVIFILDNLYLTFGSNTIQVLRGRTIYILWLGEGESYAKYLLLETICFLLL